MNNPLNLLCFQKKKTISTSIYPITKPDNLLIQLNKNQITKILYHYVKKKKKMTAQAPNIPGNYSPA